MSDSVDVVIRCRSCGKEIAHASATIRADAGGAGDRIKSQATWILGRLQCAPCAEKDGRRVNFPTGKR